MTTSSVYQYAPCNPCCGGAGTTPTDCSDCSWPAAWNVTLEGITGCSGGTFACADFNDTWTLESGTPGWYSIGFGGGWSYAGSDTTLCAHSSPTTGILGAENIFLPTLILQCVPAGYCVSSYVPYGVGCSEGDGGWATPENGLVLIIAGLDTNLDVIDGVWVPCWAIYFVALADVECLAPVTLTLQTVLSQSYGTYGPSLCSNYPSSITATPA
jgi:hypothetical protein